MRLYFLVLAQQYSTKAPNTRLQATWPRLRERTLEISFNISCYNRLWYCEDGQAPEPPAVGPLRENLFRKIRQKKAQGFSIMINWKTFLEKWGQQLIQIPEYGDGIPSEVLRSGWLGYPGAIEADIKKNEVRIGKVLPPSYREFLKNTNGWRLIDNLAGPLWPVQKIEWLIKDQKELIDNWIKGYYYSGKPPRIPDAEYFKYGDNQNSYSYLIREEYLAKALEISDLSDISNSAVYLLNPEIIDSDNEWEAWYFEPELGVRRYRSFECLMKGEYKWFLQYNGLS